MRGGHNAAKTHCPKGHAYTDENTYRDSEGSRDCIACRREYDRRRVRDKEKVREYNRERYKRLAADPDWRKNRWYWETYGISLLEYRQMSAAQAGRCAVCKKLPDGEGCNAVLAVDHDHATGKVRGLLCGPCNRALGIMEDDIERILSLATYLENFK